MPSKTALLHIGTPKTGTTSIQQWLQQASAGGDLQPVCYPLYGNDTNQSRLLAHYRPSVVPFWMRSEFPTNDDRFHRWRRRYHRVIFDQLRAATSAIISAESLSHFTATEVTQFRMDLESVGFQNFHVVLYIRDPADFYLSLVQQRLKAKLTLSLPEDPFTFTYPFRQIAATWEQVFPGALIVRPYRTGLQHDVIDDFNEVLDQHLGVSLRRITPRLNRTLSAEGIQILQDYRHRFCADTDDVMTPDAVRLVDFLVQSTEHLPQTPPTLKPEVAERIRANHHADTRLIASRYGIDLGLPRLKEPASLPARTTYRVQDILEPADPQIAHQLLLGLARSELGRPSRRGTLPLRAATRAYRTIPPGRLPARLGTWLRSLR